MNIIERKWIISILGMYSCGLMYAIRAGVGIAMVRMTMKIDNNNNGTNTVSNAPIFDWSETLQGIILGGIFYLYWIVPTIVGNYIEQYGAKWFTLIGVIGPCILTAITPLIATINVYLLIIVMILIGATQGFIYPSLFHLYVQWFPPEQRSKANSGIQVGQSIGGTLMYLIGGSLCKTSIGWPLIFYFEAALHVPWIFLWLYFGSNHPSDIDSGDNEQNLSKNVDQKNSKQIETPWLAIIKSGAVWSSMLSKFACSYGFYMFLSKIPAYLDQTYNVDIVENGFICAGAFGSYGLLCFISPYLSNWMIDQLNISKLIIRRLFQAIAMLIPCLCLILITLINQKTIMIILLIMAMLSYGFFTGGEWTMISEYAPNLVGVISGFTHILGFIAGFLSPYIVGMILDSDLGDEQFKWNISFWISAALYLIGYIAFFFLSTVEQQYWDKI